LEKNQIKAPDFILEDLKGKKVKLSDYNRKHVLLAFGATWCRYCRAEIPQLKEIYSKYKEKGLEIINIYTQESKEKVSSFTTKYELPYKVLLDMEGRVAYRYGVRGVPTNILINRDGTIICMACRDVDVLLSMLFNKENTK